MLGKRTILLGAVTAMLVTISCSTTGTVWDASIPPEQSAKIAFWCFKPTSFNGIPVKLGFVQLLTIPAGAIDFEGDVAWASDRGTVRYMFKAKDSSFSCNLEGGKEYHVWTDYEYDEENEVRIWGIKLYRDIQMVGYPPKDKLIKFIPFDPQVLSN